MHIDPERGAQALFDLTFKGTLTLLPTWAEQPEAFKRDFRERAVAVVYASVVDDGDNDRAIPTLALPEPPTRL